MADLGNQKIKDTYQLLLQTDSSGNLQNLTGGTPNPFIVNGNLRYVDGNQADGYVLKSDASGNASWGAAGAGTSYWSANTNGSISPSGTSTPIKVLGNISGSSDLYLGDSTDPNPSIIAPTTLTLRGQGSGNDYLILQQDSVDIFIDGSSYINVDPDSIILNYSSKAVNTAIMADNATQLFYGDATNNVVRLKEHVFITPTGETSVDYSRALFVSGGSLFHSGGTNNPNEAIVAVGNISGTTDLYLGNSGHTASTITAENKLTIKGHSSTNDFLTLENDHIHAFIDGVAALTVQNTPGDGQIVLNASSKNMDTKIVTDDGTNAVHVDAGLNLVRLRDRVIITSGSPTDYNQSLYVSGSSLLYSGGNSHHTAAVVAIGDISGTTDGLFGRNLGVSGRTYLGTIDAAGDSYSADKILVAQGGGEIEYLTTAQLKADIGDADYWTATTDGTSISPSGSNTTTTVKMSGNTFIKGNLGVTGLTNSNTLIVVDDLTVDTNTLYVDSTNDKVGVGTLAPDAVLTISGNSLTAFTSYNLNGGGAQFRNGQDRVLFSDGATTTALSPGDVIQVVDGGGTTLDVVVESVDNSTNISLTETFAGDDIQATSFLYNGGPIDSKFLKVYNSTTPVFQVSGDSVMSGTTDLLDIFASSAITNQDVYWTATTDGTSISPSGSNVTTTVRMSGDTHIKGNLGVSGNTYTTGAFVVGNATLNTSQLDISSGDFTLDVEGDITLDANGADIILSDDGTNFGRFKRDSSDFIIKSEGNNNDIIFRGQDAGVTRDALLLDMSDAGTATFNNGVNISGTTSGRTDASFGGNLGISGRTFLGTTDAATTTPTTTEKLLVLQSTGEVETITKAELTGQTAPSYQYISYFSSVAGSLTATNNWIIPSLGGGISNHAWNVDSGYAGSNQTPGVSQFTVTSSASHTGIPVPINGLLEGFYCNCRNNGSEQAPRNAALFTTTPDWGTNNDNTYVMRMFGAGNDDGGQSNSRPYFIDAMTSGATTPFPVTQGMVILPAVAAQDGASVAMHCTWTIVLSTSLSGIT